MWNRKQKRINELEWRLREALEDQVTVVIHTPEPIARTLVGLPVGQWYHVSYDFRTTKEGLTTFRQALVTNESPVRSYFDGTDPTLTVQSPTVEKC